MPSNTFDGLRDELNAALVLLAPQITGLNVLISLQGLFSANTLAALQAKLDTRVRRRNLISTVLSRLDQISGEIAQLISDGYPNLSNPVVDPSVITELENEEGFIEAALNEFGITTAPPAPLPAQVISVSLGKAASKTK